jgi:hypothetical protein
VTEIKVCKKEFKYKTFRAGILESALAVSFLLRSFSSSALLAAKFRSSLSALAIVPLLYYTGFLFPACAGTVAESGPPFLAISWQNQIG